eukprot:1575621-Pyramimonas_sp.AAC.1
MGPCAYPCVCRSVTEIDKACACTEHKYASSLPKAHPPSWRASNCSAPVCPRTERKNARPLPKACRFMWTRELVSLSLSVSN